MCQLIRPQHSDPERAFNENSKETQKKSVDQTPKKRHFQQRFGEINKRFFKTQQTKQKQHHLDQQHR